MWGRSLAAPSLQQHRCCCPKTVLRQTLQQQAPQEDKTQNDIILNGRRRYRSTTPGFPIVLPRVVGSSTCQSLPRASRIAEIQDTVALSDVYAPSESN